MIFHIYSPSLKAAKLYMHNLIKDIIRIISLAILDTSYLNIHFFGTHTCLCRLQNYPSADFGVFKYAWAVTQKVSNEAENGVWGSRVLLLRHA